MSTVVVVGAQWGDEGKGKVVDLFSERADMVVRYGGGAVGLAVCASAVALGVSAPWGYLAAGGLVLVLGVGTAGFLRRGNASARLAAG